MPSSDAVINHAGKVLTGEEIQECVVQLRELMDADPKFGDFRKDDSYLSRFLHPTLFNIHQAYRRVDDYYDLMLDYPDYFAANCPTQFKSFIDQNTRFIIPDARDNDGRRIMVSLLGNIDTSKMSAQQSAQLDEYWLELILDEPETQRAGLSVIMDMKGYSWGLFRWLTPGNMKIGSKKADLYPCKELVYHVVNSSALLNASLKLVWPFLTNKIKEKFHFHFDDWESLHKFIRPEILPPEYGGTGPEWNIAKINQWLYDNNSKVANNLKHQRLKK